MIKKTKSIIKSKLQIILASKSLSRKKILKETGIKFKQLNSDINEHLIKKKLNTKDFNYLAKKLAQKKALYISDKNRKAYVIGADQICVCKNKIYSKPINKKKAIEQLIQLNGKSHRLISAISICYNNKVVWNHVEIAKLKMKKLSKTVIERYVEVDLPLNSCGSYKFEANGKLLFSKVEGDLSTILGLPIFPLLNILFKKDVIKYG